MVTPQNRQGRRRFRREAAFTFLTNTCFSTHKADRANSGPSRPPLGGLSRPRKRSGMTNPQAGLTRPRPGRPNKLRPGVWRMAGDRTLEIGMVLQGLPAGSRDGQKRLKQSKAMQKGPPARGALWPMTVADIDLPPPGNTTVPMASFCENDFMDSPRWR